MKYTFPFYCVECILISLFISFSCSGEVDNDENFPNSAECTGENNIVYVSSSKGNDISNPGTKVKPKKTIQAGIDCAASIFSTGEVHVSEGVYSVDGTITTLIQESAGVVLKEGISVYGGYFSKSWDLRNTVSYPTVINDNSTGSTGAWSSPNRAIHAGTGISENTVIDGISINGGGGDFSSAITCNAGSPKIQNCIINGGQGASKAYGIYVIGSSPLISGNTISGGSSSVYTYGIVCDTAEALIRNNLINGGDGSTGSYGIDLYYSDTDIQANTIKGGTTDGASFGIQITGSSPLIINNIIDVQVGSPQISYGIYFGAATGTSNPTIANNTIISGNNASATSGIAISFSTPKIINNIIMVTQGDERIGINVSDSYPTSVENNDVYVTSSTVWLLYNDHDSIYDYITVCSGNFGDSGCGHTLTTPKGVANTSTNPLVDSNYMLTSSSPASVRQGGKDLSSSFTTDRNGKARTVPWSMGAYELD